jgi:FkbM family methyltransferase
MIQAARSWCSPLIRLSRRFCPALIRRPLGRLLGRELRFRTDVTCPTLFLGSTYGGWSVYPGGLSRDSVVYSFGIGEDITFDLALIERFGARVYAFDPTPRSIAWLKTQPLPEQFTYHEYGIAAFDGAASFYPPENPANVSHRLLYQEHTAGRAISAQFHRFETIRRTLGHRTIDLLKMDIEGAEYEVLEDIAAHAADVPQILVEFHHRFEADGVAKTERAVELLRRKGYRIFAISRTHEEYSFVRADVLGGAAPAGK